MGLDWDFSDSLELCLGIWLQRGDQLPACDLIQITGVSVNTPACTFQVTPQTSASPPLGWGCRTASLSAGQTWGKKLQQLRKRFRSIWADNLRDSVGRVCVLSSCRLLPCRARADSLRIKGKGLCALLWIESRTLPVWGFPHMCISQGPPG